MSADLRARISQAGVLLWWDNEILHYRSPVGAITPELREAMRLDRDALIVAVLAHDGILLPADRGCWPAELHADFQERARIMVQGRKVPWVEAERLAAMRAGQAWLRRKVAG